MFLWFAGLSFALVWLVFRSPALDYRLVMLGSVLPLGELVLGGPKVLHTLVFAVALMSLIMLVTQKRRLVRRRLISLPIGIMMHLVLDGIWVDTAVFWWPFFGLPFEASGLPELARPLGVIVAMELIGLGALWWCWREFDFSDPRHRKIFLETGHLPREPVP